MTWQTQLLFNEPLAPYTSWHIGGPADRYFAPRSLEELQLFLKQLPETEPLTWLGLGSNVLIADEGFRGTVIHTLSMKTQIQPISEQVIRVEAGIPCAKVSKYCAKNGLKGGEFFSGIPGTVGGALAMNAGAFGGETWERVLKVETMNRHGVISVGTPADYTIGYRSVQKPNIPEEWFVAAHFQFTPGNTAESNQAIKELLRTRNNTQPIGVFSCGSVFKNPRPASVGQLIEGCGLKGLKIGDAEISRKHANFIINMGNARAQDVLALMRKIVETVYEKHQIRLESEVRMIGYPNPLFWYPQL
jgi:UDP-N-acetylmuramate dehydrogenase